MTWTPEQQRARRLRLAERTPAQVLDDRAKAYPGGEKRCPECATSKSFAEFATSAHALSGLQAVCRACRALRVAARTADGRAAADNRRARTRRAARTDAEILADRDRLRPTCVKVCRSCREPLTLAAYNADRMTPDGLQAKCAPCAAAAEAARTAGTYTPSWAERDLYACAYCAAPYEEIEHVLALSLGGLDHPDNTVPSCTACNRGPGGKHDSDLFDWRPDLLALVTDWPCEVR
jgi:hypothetical protein